MKHEYEKAILDFEKAVRIDSKYVPAYTAWAIMLSTASDNTKRDGKRAVELATRGCELSSWKQSSPIMALAAAQAETGAFDKAIASQTNANALAAKEGDAEIQRQGEKYLKLYQEKKPRRDAE